MHPRSLGLKKFNAACELRIYCTKNASTTRLYTLMHNPQYRDETTTKGYVQSSMVDYYLGTGMTLDDEQSLECLRIPHFYGAFYVYKYATGLAAAIALSQMVLKGGPDDLTAYLNFLRGGSSRDPLDLLRAAGVDLATPEPVDAALKHFSGLVDELDGLLR